MAVVRKELEWSSGVVVDVRESHDAGSRRCPQTLAGNLFFTVFGLRLSWKMQTIMARVDQTRDLGGNG